VLQPDGKMALVARCRSARLRSAAIARFERRTARSTGFGSGGQVLVPMPGCFALTQQADGKLMIVGDDQVGDVFYGTFARLL
jgi:hypothetical protein